jgi:putative protein-disulfide isomerase
MSFGRLAPERRQCEDASAPIGANAALPSLEQSMMDGPHLIYFADPMCSWCWGFSPVIEAIEKDEDLGLPIRLVMGGLRPGTTKPLAEKAKEEIRSHWAHVHEASGQPFDYAFFAREGFVYDSDPAARAVVVMRRAGMAGALTGLRRIHRAFYAENRDVTQLDELAAIAVELGFSEAEFREAMLSEAARNETWQDYGVSQGAGIRGFPTLIAGTGRDNKYAVVTHGFQPMDDILPVLRQWRASPAVV